MKLCAYEVREDEKKDFEILAQEYHCEISLYEDKLNQETLDRDPGMQCFLRAQWSCRLYGHAYAFSTAPLQTSFMERRSL